MLALVLLSGVLGQSAGLAPAVTVKAIDDWRLRVLVRPLDERTIKAIALEPLAKKVKSARHTPHTRITLPRNEGVCFTFSPIPDEPFDVIVTLSDDSVHRLGKKVWKDPSSMPTPYMVYSHRQEPTCFKP
jgi:hypothetical protein